MDKDLVDEDLVDEDLMDEELVDAGLVAEDLVDEYLVDEGLMDLDLADEDLMDEDLMDEDHVDEWMKILRRDNKQIYMYIPYKEGVPVVNLPSTTFYWQLSQPVHAFKIATGQIEKKISWVPRSTWPKMSTREKVFWGS